MTAIEIDVPAEPLRRAVATATAVMKKKSTSPILGCGLFQVNSGELRVVASNRDVVIEETLATGRSTGDGDFTLSLRPLHRLLERLHGDTGTVTIAAAGSKVQVGVKPGVSLSVLQTIDAAEFAAGLPCRDGATARWSVPAGVLRRLLEVAAPHMAGRGEDRAYRKGMYFQTIRERWRAVATDGHTLAWADSPRPDGCELGGGGVIVPRRAIRLWQDMLARADGGAAATAEILVQPPPDHTRCIRLAVGRVAVTTWPIPSTYPDYTKVLPAPDKIRTAITVPVRPLLAAVEQIEAIGAAVATAVSVDLHLHPAGDAVSVTNTRRADMIASATVPVLRCAGETAAQEVRLNAGYFAGVLRACRGIAVAIGIGHDLETPIVVTDPDDVTWQALVMRIKP